MGLEIFNELIDIRILHKKSKALLSALIERNFCDKGTNSIREFFDEVGFCYRSFRTYFQITHIDMDKMNDRKIEILLFMAGFVITGCIARFKDEEGQTGTILYENHKAYSFGIIPLVQIESEAKEKETPAKPPLLDQDLDMSSKQIQEADYWKYVAFEITDSFGTFLAKLGKRKSVTDKDKKAIMFMMVVANLDLRGENKNYRIKPEREKKILEVLKYYHASIKASLKKPIEEG
jgi:hypothetical protein